MFLACRTNLFKIGYRTNLRTPLREVTSSIESNAISQETSIKVSGEVTYGGVGREAFILMVERGAPFIGTTMRAKVKDINYHNFSMILPKNEKLIGNVRTPCYHGGAVATMIDHVAGFCAWSALPDSFHRVSTVNLSVDYLHPPPVEDLIFDAHIEHMTNRLARVSCVVWDSQHKRKIALGRGLFNIYKGKEDLAELLLQAMKQQQKLQPATK